MLVLKENGGEIVIAHPDFRIFATANTVGIMEEYRHLYRGANLLNIAFLDRWRIYHFDYLKEKDEIKVLTATLPRIPTELAGYLARIAILVREAFNKQQVSQPFSMRRLFDWSDMIVRYLDRYKADGKLNKDSVKNIPSIAAEATIFSRVTSEERKVLEGIISRVLPS
jgi:cobaltochelatase CobS